MRVFQRGRPWNLVHDLRPLVGGRAVPVADTLAALIDGLYIRAALGPGAPDPDAAAGRVIDMADLLIGEVT